MFGLVAFFFIYQTGIMTSVTPLPTLAWHSQGACMEALKTLKRDTENHIAGSCVQLDVQEGHHD
jgi:hypothetical protein